MNDLVKIQALLEDKADCQARLNLLPYDGSPEIKEQNGSRYLYVRKRIAGKAKRTRFRDFSADESGRRNRNQAAGTRRGVKQNRRRKA